jgi:acyl carrier protein
MQDLQSIADEVRSVLIETLGISAAAFETDSPLFGALPELDSMAVATVLTEIEDRLSIVIDDDDIDGETFETFGNLVAFTAGKIALRDR